MRTHRHLVSINKFNVILH